MTISPSWTFKVDHVNRYAYWNECFTKQECELIKEQVKSLFPLEPALMINGGVDTTSDTNYRKSEVVFVQPEKELHWVYRRLSDVVTNLNDNYFKFDLFGFSEGLQFTEYSAPYGMYKAHVDSVYGGLIRKLSIVVQLTDPSEYEGGDLEIMDSANPEKLSREQGTLLAFPSYTLHQVTPVTSGTRNSLVGWISGNPFK